MLDITPGQGSALSGLFAAVGAISAVFLAQYFFRNRIADLKGAIKETETIVDQFRGSVNVQFGAITKSVGSLNESIGGVLASLAQTQAAVREGQQAGEEAVPALADDHRSPKELLSENWYAIIEHIESIASSPNVDGRTRAKYARIDRRSYYDLIKSLNDDRRLGQFRRQADKSAELWYSNRRKQRVSNADAENMRILREDVLQIPMP